MTRTLHSCLAVIGKPLVYPWLRIWIMAGFLGCFCISSSQAQNNYQDIEGRRLAQTGMKFLGLPVDAQSAAMGSAVIAQERSSIALFSNPAGMVGVDGTVNAAFGNIQWIGGIQYNVASAAFRPSNGRYGVFGVTFESVDYGQVQEVIRANNQDGYLKLGMVEPGAVAVGIGYAQRSTNRFAFGGHMKYAQQSLGASVMRYDESGNLEKADNRQGTLAFDLGVIYRTGFRSLNFAMSARNFSREITYSEESFELPLMLRIGLSMDMTDLTQLDSEMHALLFSVEGQRPRDYPEQLKAGLEYTFMKTLALRAGYVYPHDEQGVSLGGGVETGVGGVTLNADYAYTRFGIFGNVNRFSLQLSL